MNIEHLRRALKSEWLDYYRKNRHWIVRLGVWVNCQGQRRPSASFILGALSTLEPQLQQLLPLVVDLNSNPDRIILVLGLNFNPEDELKVLEAEVEAAQIQLEKAKEKIKLLSSSVANPFGVDQLNGRVPIDTAELSAHELPDRETATRRRDRNRRKTR